MFDEMYGLHLTSSKDDVWIGFDILLNRPFGRFGMQCHTHHRWMMPELSAGWVGLLG